MKAKVRKPLPSDLFTEDLEAFLCFKQIACEKQKTSIRLSFVFGLKESRKIQLKAL
jgi:hypothetical protein